MRNVSGSTSQEELSAQMTLHSLVQHSKLEGLPLELRVKILLSLHDIADIYSAIRSSALLNMAFVSQRSLIQYTLLFRYVDFTAP
jgi:hypothetical protein